MIVHLLPLKGGYTYNYKPYFTTIYLHGGAEIPEVLSDVEKVFRPRSLACF